MAAIMYMIENNTTGGFMPTVPQIKEMLKKMWGQKNKNAFDSASVIHEIELASRNSTYNYMMEYERLSEPAKKIVGNPSALQEYARMSHDRMLEDIRKGIKFYLETEMTGDIPDRVSTYIETKRDRLLNG